MVKRSDLLALNFYKKSIFTGSIGKMNYRICLKKPAEGEEGSPCFEVIIFPGPYCFAKTPAALMQRAEFLFTEEGMEQVAEHLNRQFEEQQALWATVGNGYGD